MLGLCARAGRLITGEKACIQAVRSGAARVVLLDGAVEKTRFRLNLREGDEL